MRCGAYLVTYARKRIDAYSVGTEMTMARTVTNAAPSKKVAVPPNKKTVSNPGNPKETTKPHPKDGGGGAPPKSPVKGK